MIIIISKLLVFPLDPPKRTHTCLCFFYVVMINIDFQIVPLIFKLSDNVVDVFLFDSLHNQHYKLNVSMKITNSLMQYIENLHLVVRLLILVVSHPNKLDIAYMLFF